MSAVIKLSKGRLKCSVCGVETNDYSRYVDILSNNRGWVSITTADKEGMIESALCPNCFPDSLYKELKPEGHISDYEWYAECDEDGCDVKSPTYKTYQGGSKGLDGWISIVLHGYNRTTKYYCPRHALGHILPRMGKEEAIPI